MTQIGRYQIVKELGRGAMGVVYHAIDPNIGRPVAIKTIRLGDVTKPEEHLRLRDRLFREARSAGILSHPNIVTIYDVDEQDELAFIAMEYVNGPTLDAVLAQAPPPPNRLFAILRQAAAALDYAHQKSIVHRDIKPANIMLDENGAAKITDFGIAKLTTDQLTVTGAIIGTPHYMSPEQVRGRDVDGRSDQFSLAVVAFEILTGEKPFAGDHLTTVVYKIVAEDPPRPERLNPTLGIGIAAVLTRGLAKNPEERYGSCQEFVGALESACAATPGWTSLARGGSLTLPTVAAVPRPARRRDEEERPRRRRWIPALLAVLMAAGLVGLIAWQASRPASAPPLQAQVEVPKPSPMPAAEEPTPAEPKAKELKPEEPKPEEPRAEEPKPEAPRAEEPKPEEAGAKPPEPPSPRPRRVPPGLKPSPVSVATSPPGATVRLDNGQQCTSPCTLEAPPGTHRISVVLAGHQTEHREITATGGEIELPLISLRAATGMLMLTSSPPGATIYINGERSSLVTPAQLRLKPGTYTITVEKDGKRASEQVQLGNEILRQKIILE